MRCFLILAFLGFARTVVAQNGNTDTLHWRIDRTLAWDDFQGVPDTASKGGAGTSSGFFYRSRRVNDTSLAFFVDCIFFKKSSWVKANSRDIYGLNHEQKHFDISKIYAQKMKKILNTYKINPKTVSKDIGKFDETLQKEMNQLQDSYDKETNHSLNKMKQKEWDKKIARWLKEGYQG